MNNIQPNNVENDINVNDLSYNQDHQFKTANSYQVINNLHLLTPYQFHKELIINQNTLIIDAFINGGVESCSNCNIPQTEVKYGLKYIVPYNISSSDYFNEDIKNNKKNNNCIDNDFNSKEKEYLSNISDKNSDYKDNSTNNTELNKKKSSNLNKWPIIYANYIALYIGDWFFIKPKIGCLQWIRDESYLAVYTDEGWINQKLK
ncbi:hypothetical protein [Lyticum sinuosum]|uniref:Uncharacterized protein n=1 Tax=Lyticum sinuosum TaxID=1332059 RepID=A0AAE4VJE5_9RICK|nr:hypothetical protein [Lyticum sinuosum]MDZ5760881.1 hypothetical protein [Lyticum sinuosum]